MDDVDVRALMLQRMTTVAAIHHLPVGLWSIPPARVALSLDAIVLAQISRLEQDIRCLALEPGLSLSIGRSCADRAPSSAGSPAIMTERPFGAQAHSAPRHPCPSCAPSAAFVRSRCPACPRSRSCSSGYGLVRMAQIEGCLRGAWFRRIDLGREQDQKLARFLWSCAMGVTVTSAPGTCPAL